MNLNSIARVSDESRLDGSIDQYCRYECASAYAYTANNDYTEFYKNNWYTYYTIGV